MVTAGCEELNSSPFLKNALNFENYTALNYRILMYANKSVAL
jgi:hypothetical protein